MRLFGTEAAAGRCVLITGAGGSIGSALAEAIAAAAPGRLVLLDSSELNLFTIHRRLEMENGRVPREPVLGSVTDHRLLDWVFRCFRPSLIYHAAALKHVPLLEHNPSAAVRHNALGTYTLARAALAHGASTLVLVSTDKAVNPRSIMGASKRLAELAVTALSGPACRMNAVRLGNVIGTSGSVVPIFREQIACKRPVTVTHPEATRYFLTLAGAVRAIVAAGAAACSGRILLPELGQPERILDLARSLIAEANGAGSDIPIRIIGLRDGEKLSEDLVYGKETREGTAGELQVIATPAPPPAELHGLMGRLEACLAAGDLAGMLAEVEAAVPEYDPSPLARAAARSGEDAR